VNAATVLGRVLSVEGYDTWRVFLDERSVVSGKSNTSHKFTDKVRDVESL